MSQHDFSPARALLPSVLAKLSRETGKASHLTPVWEDAVGPVSAKHSSPLSLEGTTLHVRVESPRWIAALQQQETEILSRLAERLGEGVVTALVFRAVEPK